jgi:hypothetical protein
VSNSIDSYGQKISLEADGRGNVIVTLQEDGVTLAQIGVARGSWYTLLDGLETVYGVPR